ncbi:MAG TPA: hypothetical protein VLJ59_02890 [Mycobacteriales bacterium]|nr:hypothetical protein [Mycobacteriales bacterium]
MQPDQNPDDVWNLLPPELKEQVLSYVTAEQLASAHQASPEESSAGDEQASWLTAQVDYWLPYLTQANDELATAITRTDLDQDARQQACAEAVEAVRQIVQGISEHLGPEQDGYVGYPGLHEEYQRYQQLAMSLT